MFDKRRRRDSALRVGAVGLIALIAFAGGIGGPAIAATVSLYSMTSDGAWATAAGATWRAQSFTTGAAPTALNSVKVRIRNADESNGSSVSSTFALAVYTSSGGSPGIKVTDLATSQAVGAWADAVFTYSSSQALASSTEYFIVLTGSAGGTIGWKHAATSPSTSVSPAPSFSSLTSSDSGSTWSASAGRYYNLEVDADVATVPAAPALNSVTPGNQTLAVSATLGSNGGSAVTDVEYSSDGGGSWSSSGQTTGSFTITGLANGTTYSIAVRARNTVGPSPASSTSNGTPRTLPGAPTGVSASAGDGSATITWSAPASNGGAPVTGYTATASPGGTTCASGTLACTLTGLANGTSYSFTVIATNIAGNSSPSVASTSVTPQASGGGGGGGGGSPVVPSPVESATPTPTPSPEESSTPEAMPTAAGSTAPATAEIITSPTASPRPSASSTKGPTSSPQGTPAPIPSASRSESDRSTSAPEPSPTATSTSTEPTGPPPMTPSGEASPSPQGQGESIFIESAPSGPLMSMSVDLVIGEPSTGRAVTVRAAGLKPASPVEVVLYSTPRVIGLGMADAAGDAAVQATIPGDLEPGTHTLYANGTAPDGQPVQSVGLFDIEPSGVVTAIAPPGQVTAPVSPDDPQLARALAAGKPVYDPALYPATTAAIAVAGVALLGIAGVGGLASLRSSGEAYAERGKLAVIVTKKLKALKDDGSGAGDRSRTWRLPKIASSDALMADVPVRVGRVSALGQRVLTDGAWSRAMFGTGGFALWAMALLLALYGATTVGFAPFPPALPIVLAIIVLGVLDAAAGAIAWFVVAAGALVTGQLTSLADLRTLLGLFVLYATLPLLAHVIRPLRRKVLPDAMAWFDRVCDYIMMPFFVAFAAASMFKALNGLSGLELTSPDDLWSVRIAVVLACWLRLGFEDVAAHAYPMRSQLVQPEKLASQDTSMALASVALRVAVFLLIAEPFFGLGWATWVAAGLVSIPMIMKIWEDDLPNSARLNKWFPRGLGRFAMLLIIGVYLAAWVIGQASAAGQSRALFNLLLIPGIIVGVLELVGREGGDWPDTWRKRIAGGILWVLAAGITAGLIVLA